MTNLTQVLLLESPSFFAPSLLGNAVKLRDEQNDQK